MAYTSSSATAKVCSIASAMCTSVVLFSLPLVSACGALAARKTACDGLVYGESGLTRAQYLPCAGEMMSTLDRLSAQVDAMVSGEEKAQSEARSTMRELSSLVKKAGGQRNMLERWNDRTLTSLNIQISNAYSHHQACLMVASQMFGRAPLGDEKYREAAKSECRAYRRAYESARSTYAGLR
jgi:hypothetical protein